MRWGVGRTVPGEPCISGAAGRLALPSIDAQKNPPEVIRRVVVKRFEWKRQTAFGKATSSSSTMVRLWRRTLWRWWRFPNMRSSLSTNRETALWHSSLCTTALRSGPLISM